MLAAKSNAGELVRIEDVVYARDAFENNSASRLSLDRSARTVCLGEPIPLQRNSKFLWGGSQMPIGNRQPVEE
jgi:hypothetical protein